MYSTCNTNIIVTKTSCDYQACTVLAILILLSFVTFADDFNDEEEVQSFGYKRFGKCIAVPDESAACS